MEELMKMDEVANVTNSEEHDMIDGKQLISKYYFNN